MAYLVNYFRGLTPFQRALLMLKRVLRWSCYLYCSLCILALFIDILLVPNFKEVEYLRSGCYHTDTLVPYVRCTGSYRHFELLLDLPNKLFVYPIFALGHPLAAVYSIVLWFPFGKVLYDFFSWMKERRATNE